jgi:hypothetical protein
VAECLLCGKPVKTDDAVEVVLDGMPDEKGVFHTGCWDAYEAGFDEQQGHDESEETAPEDSAPNLLHDVAESSPDDSASSLPHATAAPSSLDVVAVSWRDDSAATPSDEVAVGPEDSAAMSSAEVAAVATDDLVATLSDDVAAVAPDGPESSPPDDSESSAPYDWASSAPDAQSPSWRRKAIVAGLGLLVGAGVALIILTSSSDDGTTASGSRDAVILSSVPNSTAGDGLGAAIGQAAPRLVGTSLDGSPLTISPGGGVRSAVVFLAHWCSACQREVREIVKLANRGELKGINVAAVATATSPKRANYPPSTWLAREGWPFPALADNSRRTAANAYGITAIPAVVLVAEDARVVARLGSLRDDRALRAVRDFAAGR